MANRPATVSIFLNVIARLTAITFADQDYVVNNH
jgi:hypothetical protein